MSNVDDLKSALAEIINEPIVTHFIASVEYISGGGAREVLTFSDSELMSWEALGMVAMAKRQIEDGMMAPLMFDTDRDDE